MPLPPGIHSGKLGAAPQLHAWCAEPDQPACRPTARHTARSAVLPTVNSPTGPQADSQTYSKECRSTDSQRMQHILVPLIALGKL